MHTRRFAQDLGLSVFNHPFNLISTEIVIPLNHNELFIFFAQYMNYNVFPSNQALVIV